MQKEILHTHMVVQTCVRESGELEFDWAKVECRMGDEVGNEITINLSTLVWIK